MKRPIEFRLWNPPSASFLNDVENVYECLMQQIVFEGVQPSRHKPPYDHASEGIEWNQFSGRLDKNGRKIFEGDIITIRSLLPCKKKNDVIHYENGAFWIKNDDRPKQQFLAYPEGCYPLYKLSSEYIEVIGNIYEHPELINAKS